MDLQASGCGRREERVPLDALIELRSGDSDEVLEADGLDLGPGGLSMRASFVPPVGARLECQFRCPPEGDSVRARGEVVWAEAEGPRSGAFGLRFLELDTSSATAIRRVTNPTPEVEAPPAERSTVAVLRIDGLGAPIETDVRLAEPDRVVLEQELSFLQLGRGVQVDVPGRGMERGRIASVTLRQGPLNVPTLVFGVLLDEVRVTQPQAVAEHAPTPPTLTANVSPSPVDPTPSAPVTIRPTSAAAERPPASATIREATVRDISAEEPPRPAPMAATPPFVIALQRTWVTVQILAKARGWPLIQRARHALGTWVSETWPKAQRLLSQGRAWLALQLVRLRASGQKRATEKRRTTAPAPRPQRTGQVVPRDADRSPNERPAPRNRRMLGSALAVIGVGLGIYALAPRSEADRIPVRRRPAPSLETAPPALPAIAPTPVPAAVAPAIVTEQPAALPPAIVDPAQASVGGATRSFGAGAVPNGRVFTIRMSGPVDTLEGESREDGFTVRVPGRLALDRASPIATSHRAVARAMILNRGDYAELTVDFLPGLRPKYQVAAKDNTIEVTLERL